MESFKSCKTVFGAAEGLEYRNLADFSYFLAFWSPPQPFIAGKIAFQSLSKLKPGN